MKYFIPSYEQCNEIAAAHNNFNFYETKYVIEGYANITILSIQLKLTRKLMQENYEG